VRAPRLAELGVLDEQPRELRLDLRSGCSMLVWTHTVLQRSQHGPAPLDHSVEMTALVRASSTAVWLTGPCEPTVSGPWLYVCAGVGSGGVDVSVLPIVAFVPVAGDKLPVGWARRHRLRGG